MGDLPPMDCIEVSSFAPPDDYGLDDADALRARSTRRGRSSRSDGTGPDRRSTTAGSDAADPLRDLKEHADLTQSVAWLSKHVPECVLRSLFDGIERARADDAPLAEEPAPAGRAPPASGAEDGEFRAGPADVPPGDGWFVRLEGGGGLLVSFPPSLPPPD